MSKHGHNDADNGRTDEIDEFDPRTATYHCEGCGTEQTHDEYVAVGPPTPAARHLGLEDPDGERDHFVVCDLCFEQAAADIAGEPEEL